jgi:hypothetical protein
MQDMDGKTLVKCAPIQCKPWCSAGDGHPDEWNREDQQCRTEAGEVQLADMPKIEMSYDGMWPSQVDVVLYAPVDAPMHVEVSLDMIAGHSGWFKMTTEEAHDLAVHLLFLVAQSEGKL